jgi:hypothetical protein
MRKQISPGVLLQSLAVLAGVKAVQCLPGKLLMISDADGNCLFASTVANVLRLRSGLRLETIGGDTLEITMTADGLPHWRFILLPRLYTSHAISTVHTESNAVWLNERIIFNQRGLAQHIA